MKTENYIFDIEKIMDFVFNSENERPTDTEITEQYAADDTTKNMYLSNRIIHEVKGGDGSSSSTIRYDMIKMFIDTLLGIGLDDEMEIPMTFGENTIFNTLCAYGMIKKINLEK